MQDLAERLENLEKKNSAITDLPSAHELKDVIPKLERTVSLTEQLEADMKRMQQEVERLNQQLSAQAQNGGKQGAGEQGNAELEVLDCTQVSLIARGSD